MGMYEAMLFVAGLISADLPPSIEHHAGFRVIFSDGPALTKSRF